jgi:FAD/FMN-containing dehydrogenase
MRGRLASIFDILLECGGPHRIMTLVLPEKSISLVRDLRQLLGSAKVQNDFPTLTAYAVDASIYRLTPQAVVMAESEDDIEATIRFSGARGIPLTPRAAGTNLTGSAIGVGIIIDVSRLNRVLEVNEQEGWARVQPGIVLAELNKQLQPRRLMFGPDPSSGDMCKLGGMLANNSAGPHTLRYGAVKDNVLSLRVCLPTGAWLTASPLTLGDSETARTLADHPALESLLHMVQRDQSFINSLRTTVR